ncbi:hypothetical protein NHQ30_003730 [Ciborinia camelliae]|nr:hypothetical protein NHQ30_003730 [Ciborinia camelliae]
MSTVKEIQSMGRASYGHVADVSKLAEVEGLIEASVQNLGDLNVMIANAGIAQVKSLLSLSEEDVRRMFEVNVFGIFNCYSAAAKRMIKQGGGGKIIGAASIVAFKPFAMLSHYSASKFAVRGFTQAFAMEMAEHKITVNGYAPGIVGTAMWDLIDEELGKTRGVEKGDTIKKYTDDLILLGRTSVPTDVSKCVSYLASPDSDYMTGQTLIVDEELLKLSGFPESYPFKSTPENYQRNTERKMKWYKGQFITMEIHKPELENTPLQDRTQVKREKREKREEEILLHVYGIKTTQAKHTEADEMLGEDERYRKFLCAKPSPLRKCWTLVTWHYRTAAGTNAFQQLFTLPVKAKLVDLVEIYMEKLKMVEFFATSISALAMERTILDHKSESREMSFNWADDTDEAIAAGELPDFATDNNILTNVFTELAEIQVDISGMVSCGTSLLRCLFYKKWGMHYMGRETAAREPNNDGEIKMEKEKLPARLWPGAGKWRVKKRSPLRVVMLA